MRHTAHANHTDTVGDSYLATQQEALAHVGYPDHEAGSSLVTGHHGVLAELDGLTSLLWPSHLNRSGGGRGGSLSRSLSECTGVWIVVGINSISMHAESARLEVHLGQVPHLQDCVLNS